jgi:uncharacterized protein
MSYGFLDVAMMPSVRAVQARMGADQTGWPYIQHRGGARGFLKLVDDRTLAFADYRGNRQYITTGNLLADDRTCPFSHGLCASGAA